MGFRSRQNIEREREQPVSGKDRSSFIKRLVCRWATAPQGVIIHAGEIIMHQRIAMYALQCGRRHKGIFWRDTKESGGLGYEKRAQALSAAEGRISNSLQQPFRPDALSLRWIRFQQAVEEGFYVPGNSSEPMLEH
jgi:hypothetical protein